MNPVQIRHIRDALRHDFADHIDLSDLAGRPEAERDQAFLSRALAAMAVRDLTDYDAARSAAAVIDGYDDHGIDAVALRPVAPHIWVVQAKWSDTGKASLNVGAVLKLKEGLGMLLNSEYDKFNSRFQRCADDFEAVIGTPRVRITVVIALLGPATLGPDVRDSLDRMCSELNQIDYPMVDVVVLGFSDFHRMVRSGIAGPTIDLDVQIENWGRHLEPYSAYFGTISVDQVAAWYATHGERLFAQNIRTSLGLTEVNRDLLVTLQENPEHFWYFNNGITALCDSIEKNARRGVNNALGEFRLNGVSVVNGAQTVAGIHDAIRGNPEKAAAGRVWVRFISLEDCPDGFASDVTRATNTQNQVEERDFVALDSDQARLRDDFALSLKRSYVFKRGEPAPPPELGCSVVEAAEALACAAPDPMLQARVKKDPRLLWERGPGGAYQRLFGRRPSAYRIWRCVQVYRAVTERARKVQNERLGRAATVAREATLLTTYVVFRLLEMDRIEDPDFSWDDELAKVPELTSAVIDRLIHHVDEQFGPRSYLNPTFRDQQRAALLVSLVHHDMASGTRAPELPLAYRAPAKDRSERRARAVAVLVDARRITDGTVLEFRAVTGTERRTLKAWLAEDPRRGRATWVNTRGKPLLWTADGKQYSPTALVQRMIELAGGVPGPVQGTGRWFVPGYGSLVDLAEEVRMSLADEESAEDTQ